MSAHLRRLGARLGVAVACGLIVSHDHGGGALGDERPEAAMLGFGGAGAAALAACAQSASASGTASFA